MFYHFSQNNSGGSFTFDAKRGITHHVIIEAKDDAHANERAESIGLYFDGCDDGPDCPCCGDRWYRARGKGDARAMVYDVIAKKNMPMSWIWMEPNPEVVVHRLKKKFEFIKVKRSSY